MRPLAAHLVDSSYHDGDVKRLVQLGQMGVVRDPAVLIRRVPFVVEGQH